MSAMPSVSLGPDVLHPAAGPADRRVEGRVRNHRQGGVRGGMAVVASARLDARAIVECGSAAGGGSLRAVGREPEPTKRSGEAPPLAAAEIRSAEGDGER